MRTYVYTAKQNPAVDTPAHFASRQLAALIVSAACATKLDAEHRRIQLLPHYTWSAIKVRFRGRNSGVHVLPHDPNKLRGNWVETYPPVARDINERERQLELWGRATRF